MNHVAKERMGSDKALQETMFPRFWWQNPEDHGAQTHLFHRRHGYCHARPRTSKASVESHVRRPESRRGHEGGSHAYEEGQDGQALKEPSHFDASVS
jgi:hypothetical protein